MSTHLEIVSAREHQFATPPPESHADVQDVRAAATELANSLLPVKEARSLCFFTGRWDSVRSVLEPMLDRLDAEPVENASEELTWLQENTRLLNAALHDTAELAKGKGFPHVLNTSGVPMPRAFAVAESFLAHMAFRFDALAFTAFLDAFQETTPLNISEVWSLVPCLKLVILQEVTSRGSRVLKNANADRRYGVIDCIRSLHHIGQTSWPSILEPRLLVDKILRRDPLGAYSAMDTESRERYWSIVANVARHSRVSEIDVAKLAVSLADKAKQSGDIHAMPRLALRKTHVGYYLVGEGKATLHKRVGFEPPLDQKIALFLRQHPNAYYLTGISVVTAAIVLIALSFAGLFTASAQYILLASLVLLLPASQIALELVNYLTTMLIPVGFLPKLDLSDGIPNECATMVAVPALLLNEEQVRRLVENLEIHYLGNRDRNLSFALLTDLPDSKEPASEEDPRLALCVDLISQLNDKYTDQGNRPFLLLHRHRVYNPRERVWMGWERKRGKLMDLAKLLRKEYDSFPVKVGDVSMLPRVRFVITLDADTELPRGAAQKMIGALAHPLNGAILDNKRNVVVSGYGILQPRVGVSVESTSRSRLANVFAGEAGLDIYTRAISDVYQDLYGEAIFTGKGIWEVDALLRTLNHRFPENSLLSHDLIEGAYVRTGLATDIEVIDDYPSNYSAMSRRKHRWIRGDWQIAEWLLPRVPDATGERVRNPLSLVSRWKIFDNLRRSLVEPASFLMFVLGWLVLPVSELRWTLLAVLFMFMPTWFHLIVPLIHAGRKRNAAAAHRVVATFLCATTASALRLGLLAHQTFICFDAIIRVAVRRLITRRGLLEWETAAEAELRRGGTIVDLYLRLMPAVGVALGIVLWIKHPVVLATAFPLLLLWGCSKPLAEWLDEPPHAEQYQVTNNDRFFLRDVALRTWHFFARFSDEEHHWLVPDNVQENPERIAARTSPTDIGLLMNARQVACEMGYLTVPEFAEVTGRTLSTMEALPKHRGHFYNWYDTRTLEALSPRFVSSADSGNLLASLWSLAEGCRELLRRPLIPSSLLDGFADYLRLLEPQGSLTRELDKSNRDACSPDWLSCMQESLDLLSHTAIDDSAELRWFEEEARRRFDQLTNAIRLYCPWLLPEYASLLSNPSLHLRDGGEDGSLERLPAFIDALSHRLETAVPEGSTDRLGYETLQTLLAEARQNTLTLIWDLNRVAERAEKLAGEMDFRFLLNRWRNLLSVGYDADAEKMVPACYDLLASEARLATFTAIAKEDIPQEAWFLLGRTHTVRDGRPVLLSWTGTMFEYLMPPLWMKSYSNTLLARAQAEAVRAQQEYVADKHAPWGISESAYARRDDLGNYQYHAFGIPTVALQKSDHDLLVISPYSSALALGVDTGAALQNLRRMVKDGWLTQYGFYEAAQYHLAARNSRLNHYELVCSWMAHHQGMTLLAIANLLQDGCVQRWFHNNPRVQATELLLQEKPVRWVQSTKLRRSPVAA